MGGSCKGVANTASFFLCFFFQFAAGSLIRPLGFRAADLLMQEYEGTVTIYPRWSVMELLSFLSNFTEARIEQVTTKGEIAISNLLKLPYKMKHEYV